MPIQTRGISQLSLSLSLLFFGNGVLFGQTPPSVSKAYSVASFKLNGSTSLAFNITNPNVGLSLTNVNLTDLLPAGLAVKQPFVTVFSFGCGAGTLATNPSGSTLTLTGASIVPSGSCQFGVSVVGNAIGFWNNSVFATSNAGPSNTASAAVNVVGPAQISKAFNTKYITQGATTPLQITVVNPNSVPLTNVSFSDTLPAGLTINQLVNSFGCDGGTISAVPNTSTISLTGATILEATSGNNQCVITVRLNAVGYAVQTNTTSTVTATEADPGAAATAAIIVVSATDGPFQIRYASNLNAGDSFINIINTGANGTPLAGPGFGAAAGNICVNAFTFSPDEQLISCCSCLITPNGLASLSVANDLVSNTLTGVRPNSVVIKLLATAASPTFTGTACTNSAALAAAVDAAAFPIAPGGMRAFGTTMHAIAPAGTFDTVETPFINATLSNAELASITNRCTNIVGNGSSFGICRSCRAGGLNQKGFGKESDVVAFPEN